MDSNYCSGNKFADAINELLNSGKLTPQEATKRLADAVDKELEKPSEDIRESFIATCEDLIYAINNKDEYVSQAESSRRELEGKLEKSKKRGSMSKRIFAVASIAAVLVVGVIIVDGVLHREWLEGTSTPDQQQLEVVGNVIDPGLVQNGNANIADETREITTTNFDEAVEVLGYTPLVPTWLSEGWEIKEYYVFSEEGYSRLVVDMLSEKTDQKLKYEIRRYGDMETARFLFEQNEHGTETLHNGWDVYFTVNIEQNAAIWLDGDTSYSIYGPVSSDDIVRMINSIERGDSI